MNTATGWHRKPRWLYVLLLGVLAACVWAGWHDFNAAVPQEVVRAGIRSTIRQGVQVGIRFIVPAIIMYVLVRDVLASIRQKFTSRDAVQLCIQADCGTGQSLKLDYRAATP